jgi:hypothetical protein
MNLCINCQYIGTNASGDWEKYRCFAPENAAGVNLITGAQEYKLMYCKTVRYPAAEVAVVDCVSFAPKVSAPVTITGYQAPPPSLQRLKKSIGLGDL